MQPDDRDFEDEIRGHLALSIRERIENGEDPESARLAARREFGNVTRARESMREVWSPRWARTAEALVHDVRVALRSLRQARALAFTVVSTLALGIGANTAVFSVVREVLLRPLVNRDADRLIYIRQSAPGHGNENTTFSVPELADLKSRATTLAAVADFSTIDFTLVGLGEPRVVNAGVVGGSYFDVMGLRPALGRLLDETDDGPDAAGAAVLTYAFWRTSLGSDPNVIGRAIRLGTRSATIVGVLEPSVPYPAETALIANVVTSPHHLGATMVTERVHRMTELFARLAPHATVDGARAELLAAYADMQRQHPHAYPASARMEIAVKRLQDQLADPARPTLLLLLAAAGMVFVIACCNAANLILARSLRRRDELAVRAALGASPAALRRTLLAESLVLCSAGAGAGVLLARPLASLIGLYASRFSVRALDATVDASLLAVGAALAIAAAVALAYVPRLPSAPAGSAARWRRTSVRPHEAAAVRLTAATRRGLDAFAVVQVALSFVLLAASAMLLASLIRLQTVDTGYGTPDVLAIDVPLPLDTPRADAVAFAERVTRRVGALPGVRHAALGNFVPWRDTTGLFPALPLVAADSASSSDPQRAYARLRNVTPGFFAAVGVPIVQGRDFTEADDEHDEPVVIVSQSLAQRLFGSGRAVDRHIRWVHPMLTDKLPRRIVGVVTDVDDQSVLPGPALTVYHPYRQMPFGDRLFVQAAGDPYDVLPAVTRVVKALSEEQPVERAATLADVRASVLAPRRLNAFVFAAFAGIALLIAVVGVAGVLAFSVSARTREFGVRLALGSTRRRLLAGVLSEGALIGGGGVAAGAAAAYAFYLTGLWHVEQWPVPAALPAASAAAILVGAALAASLVPAARASSVDVMQALRPE